MSDVKLRASTWNVIPIRWESHSQGEHGTFRLLANGTIPDRCPRCGQAAQLQRARNLLCATRRPVPLVQRWRTDNGDVIRHQRPAWLQRPGEIEDCLDA